MFESYWRQTLVSLLREICHYLHQPSTWGNQRGELTNSASVDAMDVVDVEDGVDVAAVVDAAPGVDVEDGVDVAPVVGVEDGVIRPKHIYNFCLLHACFV